MKQQTFKIKLNSDHVKGGNILYALSDCVVETAPIRKWYQLLFQYVTFGLYKAPWTYKIKLSDYVAGIDPYEGEGKSTRTKKSK